MSILPKMDPRDVTRDNYFYLSDIKGTHIYSCDAANCYVLRFFCQNFRKNTANAGNAP